MSDQLKTLHQHCRSKSDGDNMSLDQSTWTISSYLTWNFATPIIFTCRF